MIEYREYSEEGLNFEKLRTGAMPEADFKQAHKGLTLFCHDIFVEYKGKILLVVRKNEPALNAIWPLGGRAMRGMDVQESAKAAVWREARLRIDNLHLLGICRTYFKTDPFGHGCGTDTINAVFYARGEGDLKLDDLHADPVMIDASGYSPSFARSLSPYVRDFLEAALKVR